jgi:hybrid polyketide synthase / nonribosomal peptide synthetase ACE1
MPLIELGMDSLIAVEIRTWFLQELEVDMPILKILGGASVADLVDHSIPKLQVVLPRFAPTLAEEPLLATNTTGPPFGNAASSQSSRTRASTPDSECVVDSASPSRVITAEDLEAPFTGAGDVLNQALAKEKGEGLVAGGATHR